MEVPLLGQNRTQKPEVIEARCAFLVYITKEGQTVMTPDINTPLTTERLVHQDEVMAACYVVSNNMLAQQNAAFTVQAQAGMAQAVMNMRETQKIQKDPNFRT